MPTADEPAAPIANIRTRPPRPSRWWRRTAIASIAAIAIAAGLNTHVCWSASAHVVAAAAAPRADLILVPGARIHADGRPYSILADRLQTARELFLAGRAPRILVSGQGGGGLGNDEVAAMRRWLEQRGVPTSAIVDDPLGHRTLDTMYRAADAFGARTAIVVTNPFHVERCVFLGRQHGLDVVGVAAPYGTSYSHSTMLRQRGREIAARLVAWVDVFVLRTTAN